MISSKLKKETLWPEPRFPCNSVQCAVLDCVKERCVMVCRRVIAGKEERMEVARRFCLEHANEYDIDRLRAAVQAPVYAIATGEKIR